jgi:two-component system, OmpR family, response regulator
LTDPGGSLVGLTEGGYALLIAFPDAAQRPLAREHLLKATRTHEDVFDRSINVQVLRLRRKIEADLSRLVSSRRSMAARLGSRCRRMDPTNSRWFRLQPTGLQV